MTTLAIRKRRGACAPDAASGGRAAALALALLALIGALAVLRVAPDLRAWWSAAPGSDDALLAHVFLFELNLPRVAAAVVAGGSLGIAGALFQSLTRNPLASPDLLGVTGGAQLGLLAAMLVPALDGVASVPLLFACGLLAAACAIAAAGGWRATPLRLVLAGSVCMLLFAALSTLVLAFFEQNIAGAALWANGSLYQPGASGLALAVRWLVAPLVALPFVIRPLNPLALGDDAAAAAGVRVDATRLAATVVAVAFTSVAVSIAGPLSYVGLVAPNLLRQVRGARAARLGVLVPLSALAGGALVLATDSAVLAAGLDATLSTGVAIALVGTPLMLAMIRRGAAWSGVLHAQPERAAGGGATRLVGRLERLEGLGWPLRGALFAASAAVVVAIVFAGVSAGPEWVTPARWWAALAGHDPVARMLIDLRMPRLLCALFAGALLAASGVAMQSVVRNPLAGPEVLGVTQGAGLVTLFALSTWPLAGQLTLAAAALTGGALSLAITLALNHRHRYAPLAVALTGIAIGALWTTLAQWLITQESVQPARFVVWLVGGTYGRSWGEVAMLLPWCALAVPVFAWLARPLDMLALGLMAPHVATMLSARRHRARLYVAAACGAVLLGAADLAARTLVAPREVPAGVLTALIGAPYLLRLLILEGRRAPHAFLGILARTARRSDYRSFT
ncbi:Fe(3+)-hydroxamate ABC transporter permease FhuB [Burkholderia vietnamiensis]|uniref:Fe(3+)-hydroxamate ABC transporter permease FhuB n=1 Tax=Burkholderia vietnamiensis TaxID=60552 RepID=UPI001CF21BC1|nr:Fe(3+)-hydroxamate ABC transporter permease FhuB [Burkholderia vietnamiensis]MCA7985354.1 Fe(3+)-hydroxamate ABC transporter permease FhuB [Burkholderia vietnamiensis]